MMKTLVFMIEEPSMREVLKILLPKLLPQEVGFKLIVHKGKHHFVMVASAGKRKFPYHKVKEIRFFGKIGFLTGIKISALWHKYNSLRG
jgi:hypothetical protein